ncbi:AAA family ATPase [Streptomyces sp. NPDC020681]|uniref:helix-turn-helix transcriptional regulator n=1 Tax=Streptomyces sp. NPDC020681 TaxID=3365083 RepID=UPI0037967C01
MERSPVVRGSSAGSPQWVGRSEELSSIGRFLTALRRGVGGCVLVEGTSGIGKSALVSEAVRVAGATDALILRGSADEFCVSLPFQMITEALRPVRGVDPAPQVSTLWGASARSPELAGVQEALARVERECARQPVVVIASDLQWADHASLTVLGSLMRLTAQVPLLLIGELTIGSSRDEVLQLRRAILARGAHVVTLGPLPARDTAALGGKLLGATLAPRLRKLCQETGGNPLYVRELIAHLVREDLVSIEAGRADLIPGAEAEQRLPGSLGAAIADRVGHLGKDTLEGLRACSMLGASFDSGELKAVLDWPTERVAGALEEASATGVLRDTGEVIEFQAPLLRRALYESMPTPVRALRHRQIAQVLDAHGRPAERIAAQLGLVGGTADDWTLAWLASSGTALLYRAPELARRLLRGTTDALPWGDERRETLEAIYAMADYLTGKLPECEVIATRLLAHTQDPDRAAEMTWILGYALLQQSRPVEAIEAVTSAGERWALTPVWEARLCALHGLILTAVDQDLTCQESLPVLQRAMELGNALGDAQTIAYTTNSLVVRYLREHRYDEGRRLLQIGLDAAGTDPALTDVQLLLLANALHLESSVDEVDRAHERLRQMRKLALEAGTARLGGVLTASSTFTYSIGLWDEALADLELAGEMPAAPYLTLLRQAVLALISVQRGDLSLAEEYLAQVGNPDDLPPSGWMVLGTVWQARLALAEVRGATDEAKAILHRVRSEDFHTVVEDAYRLLAPGMSLALRLGEQEVAADLLDDAQRQAVKDQRSVVRGVALHCEGLYNEDPEPMREALALFKRARRVLDEASCAADLAVLLASAGELAEAKEHMHVAVERYQELGAAGELARADARWREAGLRRGVHGSRKRPAAGWESLTPTEQRIAELVADGLSNPDIGERLYCSRRTVQTHVTHILAKLGLRSRGEVAAEIAGRDPSAAALG